jgi:hypothetical protein
MIMTQEQAFLKSREQLQAIEAYVEQASSQTERIDQVERELFSQLLLLGRTLLQGFVAAQGKGDAGPTLEHEGRTLRRSAEVHPRRYLSIFGELSIERWVYGERERQKCEAAPLDARLSLPAGEFSYVLEDWLQRLCVKESFHESVSSLRSLLGLAPSERAAEQMNQRIAEFAERFHFEQLQVAPTPCAEGELLVATADGKGVPMRRPLGERVRSSPRRGKGEKANQKQMAYVGAVYSIDRYRRTADDVLEEIQRRERAEHRPAPKHKRVWAEMTRVREGASCSGRERLFIEMAVACHERNPERRKTLICLLDGEAGLWTMQQEWLGRSVGILDLFHVLERLWRVAHCLHPEKSRAAEEFVTHHLRMLLEGQVGYVIGNFRRLLNRPDVRGAKQTTIRSVIGYYANNRRHMRYDEYLAAGYPIGSGVAEGACRHLVKDRLEQTGMRWTVNGAQAMLNTRAIYLNGQWDDFLEYRIQTEQTALYGCTAA